MVARVHRGDGARRVGPSVVHVECGLQRGGAGGPLCRGDEQGAGRGGHEGEDGQRRSSERSSDGQNVGHELLLLLVVILDCRSEAAEAKHVRMKAVMGVKEG